MQLVCMSVLLIITLEILPRPLYPLLWSVSYLWVLFQATSSFSDPPSIRDERQLQIGDGSSLTISCIVNGAPTPIVTWARDGQKIETNDLLIIEQKSQVHSLVVMEANKSTFGNYSVSATNKLGTVK